MVGLLATGGRFSLGTVLRKKAKKLILLLVTLQSNSNEFGCIFCDESKDNISLKANHYKFAIEFKHQRYTKPARAVDYRHEEQKCPHYVTGR